MSKQPKFDETQEYGECYGPGEVPAVQQGGNLFHAVTREFMRALPEPQAKSLSPYKFDPGRPHATIYSAEDRSSKALRYLQDGKYFAHDGSFVRAE
ncbi:hypothetical protein G3N58_17035 [Paraburkholderia sp. Ac-20342]|uniref:hypothetical protein n=1 Tax=Paraburkholderia sp. Ac-20342 TaxID=2703889 RepID=UPI00197F5441|nr:hypothetical protein [Paraburkholderia sp. Ac-20342]MBN3848518.1 hypothetical protein [Paraburkholderia sp. Ac-20342]